MEEITRRTFLKNAASVIAVGLAAPPWLSQIAYADVRRLAAGGKLNPNNTLVVIQLTGGNDGLNTVIPYANKQYYQYRPSLAVPEKDVLALNEQLGLHPALAGLRDLYQSGKVAIVQGVGYPSPNRSHFRSMEIWQTANPDGQETYGWLGKYLDNQMKKGKANPVVAVGLGVERPRALEADHVSVPCFASLNDLALINGGGEADAMLRAIQKDAMGDDPSRKLAREATLSALDSVAELKGNLSKYKAGATYGNDAFGRGLQQVAQLISVSPKTRVIYFSSGGFDTHANQLVTHPRLLSNFGNAIKAFMADLEAMGASDRVTVMVFSEFGRRVAENGSGTDHGAAAPMFVLGAGVKGGIYGEHPSLTELNRGDLKYHTDFRSVYSSVLEGWMGAESKAVLGREFPLLKLFKG